MVFSFLFCSLYKQRRQAMYSDGNFFEKYVALDEDAMGREVAEAVANYLRSINGPKVLSLAAAPSQDSYLSYLCDQDVNWEDVYIIHLDDYVGLPANHPNTFMVYLWEHILSKVDIPLENINYILDYTGTAKQVAYYYEQKIRKLIKWARVRYGAYVSTIGIGVNGHIAFNEPHVDKWTRRMVIPVELDVVSIQQQFDDYKNHVNISSRYNSLQDVPRSAVTISCAGILDSDVIFVIVPGSHKAEAVKAMWDGPITDNLPASMLRLHHDVRFYFDAKAASLLVAKPTLK